MLKIALLALPCLSLVACLGAEKPLSLSEEMRARGEIRVEIARALEDGESKLKKSRKLAETAAELTQDADKAEKRANAYTEEAKELREKSNKLARESEELQQTGTAQVNKAMADYRAVAELPKVQLPEAPAAAPGL